MRRQKDIIHVAPFYGSHIEGYLTFTPNNNDDDTAHLSDSQFLLSKQEEAYENHCYIWGVIIFFLSFFPVYVPHFVLCDKLFREYV